MTAYNRKALTIHALIQQLGTRDPDIATKLERKLIQYGSLAVPALIEASSHDDPVFRFRAAYCLGKIGDVTAYPELVRLADDADTEVAYDAILALGWLGDKRAIPLLTSLVSTGNCEAGLPSAAATSLTAFGVDAVPSLGSLLQEPWTDATCYAASVIGRSGHPDAIGLLTPLLAANDPDLKAVVIEALAEIGE